MKTTLQFPKKVTKQHIGFIGQTGAGKTQGMMQLFDNFKNSKKLVVDIKGDYISTMFKKEDLIFCPFDKRTFGWNIFNDIETVEDIQNIVTALIPLNPKKGTDEYFDNGARSVLKGIFLFLAKEENPNNKKLWDIVTSPEAINYIVKNDHEARKYMETYIKTDNLDSRQVEGIISNITSHVGVTLEALSKIDGNFSFKEWTQNIDNKTTIFLLADLKIINSVLPLYRLIIEIVADEVLGLNENTNNELFFWLDEFPRLKKLNKILDIMTLVRSKGGRVVYAIQDIAQLEEEYAATGRKIIFNSTGTIFVHRTPDADVLEKILGKQDVLEYSESRTWGPHDMRDGGSHSKQKKTKPLVLASEIQNLEDLEFYIKSTAPVITKAKLHLIIREEKYPKFVQNIKKIKKNSERPKNIVEVSQDGIKDQDGNVKISADDFVDENSDLMDDISSL